MGNGSPRIRYILFLGVLYRFGKLTSGLVVIDGHFWVPKTTKETVFYGFTIEDR